VHVQSNLTPGTTYEFRLVVTNSTQTTIGSPVSFTTQPSGITFALPDGRTWEMVSPPHKEGSLLLAGGGEGITEASADGNAFAGESLFEPIEGKAAGTYGLLEANFFGRSSDGWSSETIAAAHSGVGRAPLNNGNEYKFFSQDLSKSALQPFGPLTPLAPGVTQSTPYIRADYLNGNPGELCRLGCYQPLVTETNVPVGTQYGGEENGPCAQVFCGPEVVAASPDLGHVLLRSPVALTSGSEGGLYEWGGGKLTFVGTGSEPPVIRHVISDDGSRVFFSGAYKGAEGLLLVETTTGEVVRLAGSSQFDTASADGSRVFFTSGELLVAGASGYSLYEYNLNAPAGSRINDLSLGQGHGEVAEVLSVLGASEDGSYVYFAALGVLAPGAAPATCSGGQPCANVYLYHDGTTSFVTGLGPEDAPDWVESQGLIARVSPDGRWFAFMSNRNLTGYDTADSLSGHPDEEVYLYGAGAGRLVCASCDPSGARPVGAEYGNGTRLTRLINSGGFSSSTWIASSVPSRLDFTFHSAAYQSRYLSDGGRLFFDSHDALAPSDVNATQDVYEYEPPGQGSCGTTQATYSRSSGGCVSLISSGESGEESVFLDASETGGDVFFLTAAKLVSQDFDDTFDIYDARECGADGSRCLLREPALPPPCSNGDGCKAAPSPQPAIFGSPSSATFSGAGNVPPTTKVAPATKRKASVKSGGMAHALKVCRRMQARGRKACEHRVRARYRSRQSRNAAQTKRRGQ
jgi:WD40-like Beta Propeller Repeat